MEIIKIATHDGVFHADEVFALATLSLCFEKDNKKIQVIRTRDLEKIAQCDMAVDVGGEYSRSRDKYDHHQKDKPRNRVNGIPYASFGLIWKRFGKKLTSNKSVVEAIEKKLVMPIDALDNGISISTPVFNGVYEFSPAQMISAISKAFDENEVDLAFEKCVEIAGLVLKGEIFKTEAKIEGEKIIDEEIKKQGKPEILVLDKYVSWEVSVSNCKNIKLVIFPDSNSSRWCIQAARDNLEAFNTDRISFPKHWRGLSNQELVEASGVTDSAFCHTGGFFAVAKSKEAAVELANKTISQIE